MGGPVDVIRFTVHRERLLAQPSPSRSRSSGRGQPGRHGVRDSVSARELIQRREPAPASNEIIARVARRTVSDRQSSRTARPSPAPTRNPKHRGEKSERERCPATASIRVGERPNARIDAKGDEDHPTRRGGLIPRSMSVRYKTNGRT